MISIILSILLIFSPAENSKKARKNMNKETPPGTVWVKDNLYIDATELTNIDYREYYFWVKNNDKANLSNIILDTLVWETPQGYMQPFVDNYHKHVSYSSYPVVGVSHKQAVDYCKWRSDRVNERIYKEVHKLDSSKEINIDTIPKYVKYRLPTIEEWEFSAKGGLKNTTYPWGGYYLTNYKGSAVCNFNKIGDENIMLGDSVNKYVVAKKIVQNGGFTISDYTDISAPVKSYSPNNYGVYNTSGNIAEMVSTKGIAKGGSWKLPGYYCQIDKQTTYTKPQNDLGFRCVCEKLIDWN